MDSPKLQVLVLTDEPALQTFLVQLLQDGPGAAALQCLYGSHQPHALDDMMALLADPRFSLILVAFAQELNLPLLHQLYRLLPNCPLVVIGKQADDTALATVLQTGAQDYLSSAQLTSYWLHRALQHAIVRRHTMVQTHILASLLTHIQDPLIVTDLAGTITYWNAGATALFGYTATEMLGQTSALLHPDQQAPMLAADLTAIRHGYPLMVLWQGRHKTGKPLWLHVRTTVIYDNEGRAIGFLGLARHMTVEQRQKQRIKQMLAQEQAAHRRFLDLVHAVEGVVWEADPTPFRFTFVSRQIEHLLGYPLDHWLNAANRWSEAIHPDDRPWVSARYQQAALEPCKEQLEYRLLTAAGHIIWLKDRFTVVQVDGMTKLRGIMVDVTARHQTEAALQCYAHSLETLNEVNLALAHEFEPAKLIQLVTDSATTLSGATCGAFLRPGNQAVAAADLLVAVSGAYGETLVHMPPPCVTALFGPTFGGAAVIRLADVTQDARYGHNWPYAGFPAGPPHLRSYLAVPVVTRQGEVIGGLFLGHEQADIFTAQAEKLVQGLATLAAVILKKAQLYAQLEESQARFQQLIEEAADAIFVGDQTGVCQVVNTAACHLLGYTREELIGQPLIELVPQEMRTQLSQGLTNLPRDQALLAEGTLQRKDGAIIPVESHVKQLSPQTWQAIVRDISARKQTEARLRQQDRLAIVGQLAAGIAHDFKNSLAIILLQAQIMQQSAIFSAKEQRALQIICEQAQRAAHLTGQVLDFSRQTVLDRQPLELKPFLSEIVALLTRILPESIQLHLTCPVETLSVMADATHLQQVFFNLALNARDAMCQGGTLQMTVTAFMVTAGQPPPVAELAPGPWVCVTVADTGHGIAPLILPHIFEPFFTTKVRGQGTGLGLAQVHGIMHQHGGLIDVTSQVGVGTRFQLYLPLVTATQAVAVGSKTNVRTQGQGETILIVEDDAPMCDALTTLLQTLNYQVLTAANGLEAIKLFKEHRHDIGLIISDLVMPNMDGRQLLRWLRQQRVVVKLIMMTGYPQPDTGSTRWQQGIAMWLAKPFSLDQLATVVRSTLLL